MMYCCHQLRDFSFIFRVHSFPVLNSQNFSNSSCVSPALFPSIQVSHCTYSTVYPISTSSEMLSKIFPASSQILCHPFSLSLLSNGTLNTCPSSLNLPTSDVKHMTYAPLLFSSSSRFYTTLLPVPPVFLSWAIPFLPHFPAPLPQMFSIAHMAMSILSLPVQICPPVFFPSVHPVHSSLQTLSPVLLVSHGNLTRPFWPPSWTAQNKQSNEIHSNHYTERKG